MLQREGVAVLKTDLQQIEIYALRQRVLELERELHTMQMSARYELKEGDGIDLSTGMVVRATEVEKSEE